MQIITGNTEIEKHTFAGGELYFKREDKNPSGSFKDRLVSHIWPELVNLGEREIVVSSSGNLAISLLYFQKHAESKLPGKIKVFIKNNLPQSKYGRLASLVSETGAELVKSQRPKSDCFKYAKANNAFWVRNSVGQDFPKAYHQLATEITNYENETNTQFDVVFICASSGTALQGLLEGLIQADRGLPVYAVQTSHIHPIAKEFDTDFVLESVTEANAISDRVCARKPMIMPLLQKLNGSGVIVSNSEIDTARASLSQLLKTEVTGNAALSLAAFSKLSKKGYNFNRPLIIISGN